MRYFNCCNCFNFKNVQSLAMVQLLMPFMSKEQKELFSEQRVNNVLIAIKHEEREETEETKKMEETEEQAKKNLANKIENLQAIAKNKQ